MEGHSSRAGEGVANSQTNGWKSEEFRQKIVKEIAKAVVVNSHQTVTFSISHVMAWAKRLEEKVNASAQDEADYNLKIRSKIRSIEAKFQVHGPKPLATCFNPIEAASSSGSNERVAGVDWQEVLYQKVRMLRSKYLPILSKVYQDLLIRLQHYSSPQNMTPADIERGTMVKKVLEEIFTCLNVTKSQISPDFKSKLDEKEVQINIIARKFISSDHKGPHSTVKSSIQQAVPSQSRGSQDKLSEKQLTLPSMSRQISHLSEQIPNQNPMNPQVKSAKSEQDNQEKLTQQVAKEYSISQKHGNLLSAVTSDQPSPAIQHLVKVVSSMSHKSLSESVTEIRDIVRLSDISSAPFKRPKNVICSNSVVDLSADSQAGCSTYDFLRRGRKVRRSHNATPLYTASLYASMSESLNPLTDADESYLNSVRPQVKWPMNEEKCAVLKEIKEVKKLLLDTKVVINEADIIPSVAVGAAAEEDDGLIVELYFTGVTVSMDPMSHLVSNQMSIIKPLRLLIPTSYPISSPILLDEMPLESRDKPDDLSTNAKLKLQSSLQRLTHPLSIKNIAMSWETCAREAICDYAQKLGGGTFSSKYGGWEKCCTNVT